MEKINCQEWEEVVMVHCYEFVDAKFHEMFSLFGYNNWSVNYYRKWGITSYVVNVFCDASFRNNGFHGNCASNIQIEVESAMFVENYITSSVSSLHGILVTCNTENQD